MRRLLLIAALLATPLLAAAAPASAPELKISAAYLYDLSSAAGVIPSDWVTLAYDWSGRELLAVDSGDGIVRIFNDAGMETFSFGDDTELGHAVSVAALENGELVVLSHADGRASLVRCSFRGRPLGRIEPRGVPAEFARGFAPRIVAAARDRLFLADKSALKVLVTDLQGATVATYDLTALLDLDETTAEATMGGFGVGPRGELVFTIPSLFAAYVIGPSGELRSFGSKGSVPGKFNVAGGIAVDERGFIYVTDTLRAVVIAFDPQLRFVAEFGGRGLEPGRLVAPLEVAAANGRVYVSQNRKRGVSVFGVRTVRTENTAPEEG